MLVGPTAIGKTAVALRLAERWPVLVVSADSRQIYRGLDIGTAKPTPEEQERVPHVGIDLIDPGARFSAGRFAREAAAWIAATERQPIVVGGTGFYVRALAEPKTEFPHSGQTVSLDRPASSRHKIQS